MQEKSLKDIYTRNFKGTFFSGFTVPPIYPLGALVPVIHLALLPVTLTVVPTVKTLVDFYSREEISETFLNETKQKISNLDAKGIASLIQQIYEYESQVQSSSSKQLIRDLKRIARETETAIKTGYKEKKLQLQKEQLGIDKNPELLDVYKSTYISNLLLDENHQEVLDSYQQENKKRCQSERLETEKTTIQDYLSAKHNAGKRMQHIIFHFFSPEPTPIKELLPPTQTHTVKPL